MLQSVISNYNKIPNDNLFFPPRVISETYFDGRNVGVRQKGKSLKFIWRLINYTNLIHIINALGWKRLKYYEIDMKKKVKLINFVDEI